MKALTFNIKLLEPLLATGLEGDPNAGVSMKYIAGSVLRGAIIGLYLRKNKKRELQLDDAERNLFFDGAVHYLNSYPLIKTSDEESRSFPMPSAWQRKKGDDSKDFENFCKTKREQGEIYKPLSDDFFAFDSSNEIVSFSPKFRLAIHTQRDAEKGRATEEIGAVYRYESIAEGAKFSGAILGDDESLEKFKCFIEKYKKVTLGGSRSAGYGKAEFYNVEINDNWQEFWQTEDVEQNAEISLYLLSNVLIRDEKGSFKSEISPADFGLKGEKIKERTFVQTELVGGFNQKWGLPLPQTLSIKAGSVFTFNVSEAVSAKDLQKIAETGIGEKTVEGFGRVAFDLATTDALSEISFDSEKSKDVSITNGYSAKVRDKILEGIIRQKLDSQLVHFVTEKYTLSNGLSNSQISRFRMFIRKKLQAKKYDLNNFDEFFKDLKSNAKNQFQKAKIDSIPLEDWIKKNRFEKSWEISLGGKKISGEGLKEEYNWRLIDGILAKAAKENRNK